MTKGKSEERNPSMKCALTRKDISQIVLAVVQFFEKDQTIDENTTFDIIGADGMARRRYWNPIKAFITEHGCKLSGSPDLLESDDVKSVGDIVNVVFKRIS
jgi:hypothetical protein